MTVIDSIKGIVESIQDLNGVPYFDIGNRKRLNKNLSAKNLVHVFGLKKFPLIFLLLDIRETKQNNVEYSTEADLDIFIIGRSEFNRTDFWRHENTMPTLRTISDNFNAAFKQKWYGNFEYDYIERFLPELDKNTEIIDAIELHYRNALLTKCNK